jgi:hypothetical protein
MGSLMRKHEATSFHSSTGLETPLRNHQRLVKILVSLSHVHELYYYIALCSLMLMCFVLLYFFDFRYQG